MLSDRRLARTAVIALLVLALGTDLCIARRKPCKRLCRETVSACVASTCTTLGGKPRRVCKRTCKRETLRACKADPERGRCRPTLPTPGSSALVVTGTIRSLDGTGGTAAPLAGGLVRVASDRDGDGAIGGGEAVETTTGDDGRYRLEFAVNAGERVVVRASSDGRVPVVRTLRAGPFAEVVVDAVLRPLDPLDCDGAGRCRTAGGDVSVDGLPAGATGSARGFSPSTETSAFPGAFGDDAGNLLRSGAFAYVTLTDAGGGDLATLPSPATLRMRISRSDWRAVTDVHPGTGSIEVPLYAFDDARGTWTQEGEGVLEDGAGTLLPEVALAAIRDGSFGGEVVARGGVGHFSWWNVDWPVSTKDCIGLLVRRDDGRPAEGATVQLRPQTYQGSFDAVTAGADGRVDVEVLRSEAPGEDLDEDAVPGETHRTAIAVAYAGAVYDGGTADAAVPGTPCGPVDAEVTLDPSKVVASRTCTIRGRALDEQSLPVGGAFVVGLDQTVSESDFLAGCSTGDCVMFVTTGADGGFELVVPVRFAVSLFAVVPAGMDSQFGELEVEGCPAGPLEIRMERVDS